MFQYHPLHGHHLDGKPIAMRLFNLFFYLLNKPRFPGLARGPNCKITAAFFRVADQLSHATVDQVRSGHAEMGFAIHGALGIEMSHVESLF